MLVVVLEGVAGELVVPEPVVSEPVVSEPVVSEPVVSEPVVSEPVVSEPVVPVPEPLPAPSPVPAAVVVWLDTEVTLEAPVAAGTAVSTLLPPPVVSDDEPGTVVFIDWISFPPLPDPPAPVGRRAPQYLVGFFPAKSVFDFVPLGVEVPAPEPDRFGQGFARPLPAASRRNKNRD